jgi:hypothetical protein
MGTYQFHNRRPSKAQIMARINNALSHNEKTIGIEWGENCIELQYFAEYHKWGGRGFIGQVSGHSIAGELNGIVTFIKNHFQIINVREQSC